jgi:hypothetical protein
MRARILAVVWLAFGIALWCGLFEFYIERGANEFLRRHAQHQLPPFGEAPSLQETMSEATQRGVLGASIWAVLVTGCGWTTIVLCGRRATAPDDAR